MIVSHTHKYVCLNSPKTGSGFRERHLHNYCDKSIILSNIKHSERHLKYTDVCEFFQKHNWNIEDYYTFTFVRNPWHRLESWYNMCVIQNKYKVCKYLFSNFVKLKLESNLQYDYAYSYNRKVDYIGTLESIETDLLHIFNKLKLNIKLNKQRKDNKCYKHYAEVKSLWTQDLIDMVSEKEKWVIDEFNYKYRQ